MSVSTGLQLHKGTILDDRYEILDLLGTGGFGITYKATSRNLNKTVAIKEFFCQEYMTRDSDNYPATRVYLEGYQERFESDRRKFLKEARIIRDFSEEPGIVHILDYFESNQTAYIVMEYLEGETLKDWLAREKRIPARDIFKKMIPLITTLGKVHNGGVIHRDISPDNIMVLKDGSLVLIDFGAARNFTSADTSYAMVLKDGYTPQEQYTSQEQGPWTDIYALSATLYQCITGHVPENALQRILHDELKKPSELSIKIDSRLEHILMKGLALDSTKRYQTSEDMMKAIREVIPEEEGKKGLSKKAKILLSLTTLLTLAVILSSIWYARTHWIEIKFRGKDTLSIILERNVVSQKDYDKSLNILKERLKVFTGDQYVMRQQDKNHTEIIFLESLCQGKEIPYVLRNYLSRPMTFSVNVTQNNDKDPAVRKDSPSNLLYLLPGDFLDVSLKKGQLAGISESDRESLDLPASGDYYYIHVTLTKETASEMQDLYQHKDKSFLIGLNVPVDPTSVYTLPAYPCQDGQSFDIIDKDQEKHFQETMVHNLTSSHLPEAFLISYYNWPVQWENPTDSLYAGDYQVKRSALKGETLAVKYKQFDTISQKQNTGKWIGSIMAFKARLDSLEIPYAFGLSKEDSQCIIIRMETSQLLGVMPDLLCSDNTFSLETRLGSLHDSVSGEDSIELTEDDKGQKVLRCKIYRTNKNNQEISATMNKYHDLDYYLTMNHRDYFASGKLSGTVKDDWWTLNNILITDLPSVLNSKNTSKAERLFPLLKTLLQEDLVTLYVLGSYRFYDSKGNFLRDKMLSDLPGYYEQTSLQALEKAAKEAGFSISIDDTSIALFRSCEEEAAMEALKSFESFYQEHKMEEYPFNSISFAAVSKDESKTYLSIFISSNTPYDDHPGQKLSFKSIDQSNEEMLDYIKNNPFYDPFTVNNP